MNKEEFLSKITHFKTLQIIGPMETSLDSINIRRPTIFVDGGLKYGDDQLSHSISIGDNDSNSSSQELDIILDPKKDFSDLDAALGLIPDHVNEVTLYGFLGGRLDHQMINLGSIHHFLKRSNKLITCYFENKIIVSSAKGLSFNHQGTFSIMSLERQEVRITGECEYQIEKKKPIDLLTSYTLSNIAKGEVHIESELPLFIYLD